MDASQQQTAPAETANRGPHSAVPCPGPDWRSLADERLNRLVELEHDCSVMRDRMCRLQDDCGALMSRDEALLQSIKALESECAALLAQNDQWRQQDVQAHQCMQAMETDRSALRAHNLELLRHTERVDLRLLEMQSELSIWEARSHELCIREDEAQRCMKELEDARLLCNTLLASRSWRVTRPLRALARLWSRIKR